jgi:hypothetical protein
MGISSELTSLLRNRRAELWVCQRYDLQPGAEPHDYSVPSSDAGLRYRLVSSDEDRAFSQFYWNAVWLEGANSSILRALREEEKNKASRRRLVVLASESDANADVSSQSFLPAFVLPGLIESPTPDAEYGSMGRRARESLAWTFACKIKDFPGSVLVVLGAEIPADLDLLWETISDSPVRGLKVLVAWPGSLDSFPMPSDRLVDVNVYLGTAADLHRELAALGMPDSQTSASETIRVGAFSIPLSSQDTQFVTKRLALLYESAFVTPGSLKSENLDAFFDSSLSDWSCYSSGVLPVQRSYRTDLDITLQEDVLARLKHLARDKKGQRTFVFQLPSESASGATTLLRHTAYLAAEAGFPTLVVRPEQVDLDIEDLLAFITTLNNATISNGITELPPVLLVLDVEHSQINRAFARQVAQAIATQGRKAVVLQALRSEDEGGRAPSRSERWAFLPTLQSYVTEEEVSECSQSFAAIAKNWSLGTGVQELDAWKHYQGATSISGPNGSYGSEALFWVAIRFFVCEGTAFLEHGSLRDSLSGWIVKRTNAIESKDSRQLINYIAALSSFRLISPMTSVLRPIVGSGFSSEVVDTLRQLQDIVDWKDFSTDLDDQVLTFRHPSIANEYLRTLEIVSEEQTIKLIKPVLEKLSPGSKADLWLAERLASTILAPESRSRANDWDWRLEAFGWIPLAISERSKAVLHHWARCLSRSANSDLTTDKDRHASLTAAIHKLNNALSLERRPGRDEHPAHIYNTLGVVYNDMAVFLESQGAWKESEIQWDKACNAFERSMSQLSDDNVIASLAFSNRLLRHAKVYPSGDSVGNEESLKDTARAVALLDSAEEAITGMAAAEPNWYADLTRYKSIALKALDGAKASEYIENLKRSENPGLGYYCEARIMMGEAPKTVEIDSAVKILSSAMDRGIVLGAEALRLLAQLMRKSERYNTDYSAQITVYRKLERAGGAGMNTVDMFRLAVLCYQTNASIEGKERFRKLREIVRQAQSSSAPPRTADYWKDRNGHLILTQVRVDKVYSDWRGEGYVDAIGQTIPLRPRHFSPLARTGEFRECNIRFEIWGPLAIPVRHDRSKGGEE